MLTLFRDTLAPGGVTYVWSAAGGLDPAAWVMRGPAEVRPVAERWARRSVQYWTDSLHHALRVPHDTPLGVYTLHQGGGPAMATVTVVDRRPGLAPGEDWTGHTFSTRLPTDPYALFTDCAINLWYGGHADHSAAHCLYLRCHFRGMGEPPGTIPLKIVAPGAVACIDCTFEDVISGPVLQSTHGEIAGVLLSGTTIRGCDHAENAGQGIACEGAHAVRDSLILSTRATVAGEGIQFWDCPTAGNVVRDFTLRGGLGLWVGGSDHRNNVVTDGEIDGGVLCVPPTGWAFAGVEVMPPRRTRGSHFDRPSEAWPAVRDSGTGAAMELYGVTVRKAVVR